MNFKKQARQLETFLDEEFKSKLPIALLADGSLAYNGFIVKKNKQEQWQLSRAKGLPFDTFNVKSCAIIAAKLYGAGRFEKYSELKILDDSYHKNNTDAVNFKQRYTAAKDLDKRDLYVARYVNAEQHANYAKAQIASKFKMLF
jgi:hypothetical protein